MKDVEIAKIENAISNAENTLCSDPGANNFASTHMYMIKTARFKILVRIELNRKEFDLYDVDDIAGLMA